MDDEYEVRENKILTFDLNAITTCNQEPIYSIENLPQGATFEGNTFYWETDYEVVQHVPQPIKFIRELFGFKTLAAAFEVKFTVEDACGGSTDTEKVVIWVYDVNRAPKIKHVRNLIIQEGGLAYIYTQVKDADGDKLFFDFEEPFNDKGYWQTQIGDVGNYFIDLDLYDGYGGKDSSRANVEVVPGHAQNHAPVLYNIGDKEVCVGDTLEFDVDAFDQDGDRLTFYTVTSAAHVDWEFDENTGHFIWETTEVGGDKIVFGVSDGELYDEERVDITIIECEDPEEPDDGERIKHKNTRLSAYSFDNIVRPGETLYINTHVVNSGEIREHVRVRIIISELDIYLSKYFDLDDHDDTNKVIGIEIPADAEKGEYLAFVDLTSKYNSDNEYVMFEVV